MTASVTVDDAQLKRVLKSYLNRMNNPKPGLIQVGKIIVKGIKKQIDTKGAHWGNFGAGSYPNQSEFMAAVRKWQGYNVGTVLEASGGLKNDWVTIANGTWSKGCIVGNTHNYAGDVQEKRSGSTATFVKKSGTGSWTHTFKNKRAYEVIPVTRGFTSAEIKEMTAELVRYMAEANKA